MGTHLRYLKEFERSFLKKRLTITVTGLSGSGKNTIAEAIRLAFKLKIFSAGDIQRKFAKKIGQRLDITTTLRPKEVDYEMDRALLRLAIKGGYVLIGRLSAWVAGDWAECKIFVDCKKNIRAQRVALRDGLTIKEAAEQIERRDKADGKQYLNLYGIDVNKRDVFDLIIDNNRPGIKLIKKQTINQIKKILKHYDRNKNN